MITLRLPPPLKPLFAAAFALLAVPAVFAQPVEVCPVREGPCARLLNGTWQFKYLPSLDAGGDASFRQPDFDARVWGTIAVPGHWELQGHGTLKYASPDAGTGLYRTTFRVPEDWRGRRVFLRFEGVLFGFEAWLNGRPIGSWASGFNPCTFEITSALRAGADNLLAVSVTTRSKGWEFDTNDDWALSGIYRDVVLFSTPATCLRDCTVQTRIPADGPAEVCVAAAIDRGEAPADALVEGRLLDPAGGTAARFTIPFPKESPAEASVRFSVPSPQLWTAETPRLYRLELDLQAGGGSLQKFEERIGLREVSIANGVLKLNGRPVKLRGADHHDLWPDTGRVATADMIGRDLEMMRAANMNFLRTSHYPPDRCLLDACDEKGIYVMCEVPFGFGDKHLTDPSYQDILLTRARATVLRDKNHPSVIVWSVGNENPVTPIALETGRSVKQLDPTRPVCFPQVGSYFDKNRDQIPDWVDIYSPHYPTVATLQRYASTLDRPVIVTEYAHALGLATDRIEAEWGLMSREPRLAGGAVWMFQDQGIRRTAPEPVDPSKPTGFAWPDARHYFDTDGTSGVDGIVYSDRTPQIDYWEVRKVYSPVQIAEGSILAAAGSRTIPLTIENRFDFRALDGIRLAWRLVRNGRAIQSGAVPLHAAAHASETVTLPATVPQPVDGDLFAIEAACTDEGGLQLYERSLRLDVAGAKPPQAVLLASLNRMPPSVAEEGSQLRIAGARSGVVIDRSTGEIRLFDHAGRVFAEGPYPHAGRRLTLAETMRAAKVPVWRDALLRKPEGVKIDLSRLPDGVRATLHARYARGDVAGQWLEGDTTLFVRPDGSIEIAYDYVPVNATGTFVEAGAGFLVSPAATELRWIGRGPCAGYPGKDAPNEFGLHHLNRRDIRFQGNRRGVDLAVLSEPDGGGLAIAGEGMDVAVENLSEGTVFSHNAAVSGRGNKGGDPEQPLRAADVHHIAGRFTVIPFAQAWPEPLLRWFGDPAAAVEVQHPFVHSYDQ